MRLSRRVPRDEVADAIRSESNSACRWRSHFRANKELTNYLAEFDFRYSNRVALGVDDEARTEIALKGAAGKRLTYRGAC